MEAMEQNSSLPQQEPWSLEGTYTEQDLRAFAAFLAGRVAGSKLWTLGAFVLLPLLWSGNIRTTWPRMAPIAVLLIAFMVMLRFVVLPNKLYKAAVKLPGVFAPRRITIDATEVHNCSEAGGHTFRLEEIREVITTPEYLFVMVAAKQGIPIPKPWIGGDERASKLREKLLSRSIPKL
jgi:hypothetical protein